MRRPTNDPHHGLGRGYADPFQPVAADHHRSLARLGGLRLKELDAVLDRQVRNGGLLPAEQHAGPEQAADDLESLQGWRLGRRRNAAGGCTANATGCATGKPAHPTAAERRLDRCPLPQAHAPVVEPHLQVVHLAGELRRVHVDVMQGPHAVGPQRRGWFFAAGGASRSQKKISRA